jgi:hypothetical protein
MRRTRLVVAFAGLASALTLVGPATSGFVSNVEVKPAPPLTEAQLAQLRRVTSWRLEYTRGVSVIGLGSGSLTQEGELLATWSTSEFENQQYRVKATLGGQSRQSDCASRSVNPCVVKYGTPGSLLSVERFEESLAKSIQFRSCSSISGNDEPIRQKSLFSVSGAGAHVPDGSEGKAAHGVFLIDYTRNPPLASVLLEYDGPPAHTINSFSPGCDREESRHEFDDPFNALNVSAFPLDEGCCQGGDTQVRLEGGVFVIRGVADWTSEDPLCRPPGPFDRALLCANASLSRFFHERDTWTLEGRVCADPDGNGNDDDDGDALCDDWETNGLDADGDGTIDVDLPAMGADPRHKDVFVEIDAIQGFRPRQEAIDRVVKAFDSAPVANEHGGFGIHLHVDNGAASPLGPDPASGVWGSASHAETLANTSLGQLDANDDYSWESNFDPIKRAHFDEARSRIFHYVVAGGPPLAAKNGHVLGQSRGGLADGGASDFWTALRLDAPMELQATTFMHELGHNLGLGHGGQDHLQKKPNYLSVMNYLFPQGLQWRPTTQDTFEPVFDYSRFDHIGTSHTLGVLDEDALVETDGFSLSDGNPVITGYKTYFRCPGGPLRPVLDIRGSQDWSCDGQITGLAISVNLNGDAFRDRLVPYEDWNHLVYDGGLVGSLTAPLPAVTTNIEPTVEELEQEGLLGRPDSIAPSTTAAVSPDPNAGGWNRGEVTVTLTATDDPGGSGVRELVYRADGAQPIAERTVAGSTATLAISGEGQTTVTYFARDNAGNAEQPKTLTVKLDLTPPVVRCSATPDLLWPPNHTLVDVTVAVVVQDAVSGDAGLELTAVASSEPQGADADILGFAVGTPDTDGRLRAERRGDGPGRTYSLTYRGFDQAGNADLCAARVRVPHDRAR